MRGQSAGAEFVGLGSLIGSGISSYIKSSILEQLHTVFRPPLISALPSHISPPVLARLCG